MRSVILPLGLTTAVVALATAANARECEKTHTCPPSPVPHHRTPTPPPHRYRPVYAPTPTPTQAPAPTPTPSPQTMANYSLTWRLFPAYAGESYTNEDYAARIGRMLKQNGFVRNPYMASDRAGLMWYGYDVVAALDRNEITAGRAAYSAVWVGAVWAFATKADLDAFVASPSKYRPVYGGLCAYCLAVNHVAAPDSAGTFLVHNNALFLFASPQYKTEAMKDMSGTITAANRVWGPLDASGMVAAPMGQFSQMILNAYNGS